MMCRHLNAAINLLLLLGGSGAILWSIVQVTRTAVGFARKRKLVRAASHEPPKVGPPVRVTAEFMESMIKRLMLADAVTKWGELIPAVIPVSHGRRPAVKWDGHVLYCDPSRQEGTDAYALRVDGIRKCIQNLVTLRISGNEALATATAGLSDEIMDYLVKSEAIGS